MTADTLMARVPLIVRAGLAIILLGGMILGLVLERASVLRNGTPVRLATAPVDPRDLFRGDYVVLSYEIGLINPTRLAPGRAFQVEERVAVGLRAGPGGQARAAAIVGAGEPRAPGLVWLDGRVVGRQACATGGRQQPECADGDILIRVTYGLESYFVPQGEGHAIEVLDTSRVEVVAAVAANGRSAIKALLVDGQPRYTEPPY